MRKHFLLIISILVNISTISAQVKIVTPQDFGAKGDGITDDTKAFLLADKSAFDVFVPAGEYVVNDMIFASSKSWTFQRSTGNQWFAKGNARILTRTATRVTHGAKINNLNLVYNGNLPLANRPVGLILTSHFSELHSVFVSYFSIGVELGGEAHCDYTKIYDLYSWYNYFCGVKIAGTDKAQVNFVSFYDCNIGSNGIAVHNRSVKPDISRGYGFYIATANAVYISNADVSSNETAGIYIDNSTTLKQTRGLTISMLYAEHNKYCNIYYNNGPNASPSNCRSKYIDVKGVYFMNDVSDIFFKKDVVTESEFIPASVSFPDTFRYFCDTYSPEILKAGLQSDTQLKRIYGLSNNSYKITLNILPKDTGKIIFQNLFCTYNYDNGFYQESRYDSRSEFTINVIKGKKYQFTYYVTFPNSSEPIVYLPSTYGVTYSLISGNVQNISIPDEIVGEPIEGATRIQNGTFQVYIQGWKTVQIK